MEPLDTLLAIAVAISASPGGDKLAPDAVHEYAYLVRDVHDDVGIDPITLVAVVAYESKWRADAVLPGCPRKGERPRWCNRDGNPDVGLCQLHINPAWQPLSRDEAMDPARNLRQCAVELKRQAASHRAGRCRRTSWNSRWPWSAPERHGPLQHHNMGSRGYGERVERLERRIRARTRRQMRRILRAALVLNV